jgi:hypothetical protein
MSQQPQAALLLLFDIAGDAIAEHDDWHTREHLPERLAIPGFLRGSRWIAPAGAPRYFVMYEVRELSTLASPAYTARLNNPTPWTARMMKSYIGMRRALCSMVAGFGAGLGSTALLVRFSAEAARRQALHDWLTGEVLPGVAAQPGIAGARLYVAALDAKLTREQEIRGRDGALGSALLVTGYDAGAVAALADGMLQARHFVARGALASEYACHLFHNAVTLTAADTGESTSCATPS